MLFIHSQYMLNIPTYNAAQHILVSNTMFCNSKKKDQNGKSNNAYTKMFEIMRHFERFNYYIFVICLFFKQLKGWSKNNIINWYSSFKQGYTPIVKNATDTKTNTYYGMPDV